MENPSHRIYGEFPTGTKTQQEQKAIIQESEHYTLEEGELKKLERNGTTKICIAGVQISQWVYKMHIYQQRHLSIDQTWYRVFKGDKWWPTMRRDEIQNYLLHSCPRCRKTHQKQPHNIICAMVITQPGTSNDSRNVVIEYLMHEPAPGSHLSKRKQKKIS